MKGKDVLFGDGGTEKKTRGGAEDSRDFFGTDQTRLKMSPSELS